MSKVNKRCLKDTSAKFYYASTRMFNELKIIKIILYVIAIIPIILQLIPSTSETMSLVCTLASFSLTIINEVSSSLLKTHKENAIMLNQLYEAEITGSTFSKIEYDMEMTNELHELAMRKGMSKMRQIESKSESYHTVEVDERISDDYAYLYLCRKETAKTNYLLSRMFVIYSLILVGIILIFGFCIFFESNTANYLKLIISFYPLIIPIIRNCSSCKETEKKCNKICADIDTFFSSGDASIPKLTRFYYYVQNMEFEMMSNRPAVYKIFPKMFSTGLSNLEDGVTKRFINSQNELIAKSRGLVSTTTPKNLITKSDIDYTKIVEREEARKKKEREKQKNEALKQDENTETVKSSETVSNKAETIKPKVNATKKAVVNKKTDTLKKKASDQEKPKESIKQTTKTRTTTGKTKKK